MPKRRISKYEEFFMVGDVECQCQLCGKMVKRQTDGGTNTMRNHLNVYHKGHFAKPVWLESTLLVMVFKTALLEQTRPGPINPPQSGLKSARAENIPLVPMSLPSPDKRNQSEKRKGRAFKGMSKYAPYFEAISDEQIQCNICNQKMTKVSSTTSIKRHMERLHPIEYQQMNAEAENNSAKKRKLNPLAGARRSPVSEYLAQFLQEEQAKNPKDRANPRFNPTLSLLPNELQQQLDIFSEAACSSIKVEPDTDQQVFFEGGIPAESLFRNNDFKPETKINEGRMSIAIVQVGSVLYDTPKTMDKLERFVEEAAGKGAKLVLFPEGFVGGYPKWNDFGIVLGTRSPEGREEYRKYFNSSIHENGSESERLAELAAKHGVHLVVGVIERDGDTLYCSVFFYSPEKYLGKHRKLMPTAMERCVWGCGDGSTMPVFDTELGKIGAAVCWENYMPLYRVNLYAKGIQLYLAPTVDDREVWLSTMRTIALEGRCFVVSACQFLKASDYPEDHPLRKEHGDEKVLIRGGSCAVDPLGTVLVEPDFSGEMIRYVDVDLSVITKGKFDLDCIGHYSRPDVFQLHVNEQPQRGIVRK